MNVTQESARIQGAALHDKLAAVVDERTLEIVARRRRTSAIRGRGWLVRRMLLLADLVGLTAAFLLAELAFGPGGGTGNTLDRASEIALFALTLPLWIVVAKLYGLYEHDEERTDHSTVDDLAGVFHMLTVGSWMLVAGVWLTGIANPDFRKLVIFWAVAIALIGLGRAAARAFCRRQIAYIQNAVIVGAGDVGQTIARKVLQHPEYGINLVGFVDAEPRERREDLEHLTLLGPPEHLPGMVRLFDIERVIVAFSNETHQETLTLMRALKDLGVQVDVVPRLFELVGPGASLHTIEGIPVLGLPSPRLSRSSRLLKRVLDLSLTIPGLILASPLLVLIAVAIKLDSRGPVFFRQVRMGAQSTFRMWKFRTMVVDADARKGDVAHLNQYLAPGGDPRMFKIKNDPRVTRVGRLLRRFSIDELPQLWNVVRGEMSLVGPRPLILEEAAHVADWAERRLDLKPGITGLWQVLGRNGIPFEEMVKLDYLYVTSWSLGGDIALLLRTIPTVVRRA
jgi:exopolysaccharide biosynthesis polyprenyl glycosylphosphotransferase